MRRSLLRSVQQTQTGALPSTRHLSTSISTLPSSRTSTLRAWSQRQCLQPQLQILAQRTSHLYPISHRLYSTEQQSSASTDAATGKPSSEGETVQAGESAVAEDPAKKELDTAKREIVDLKDKYLRSVAEFRNLQDRTKRELASARDFAISKFAKDLLDSVDNLDRALSTVPEAVVKASSGAPEAATESENSSEVTKVNKDLQNLYDGLKMTERILLSTLAKHGLERFDPAEKGERFDPNVHDATFMAPMPDKEDGSVFTTIQKGFSLNGRVVRAAKVGVVKNS